MATEVIMREFDSIHKFVNRLEKGHDPMGASDRRSDAGWAGTASLEEAVRFAKYGGWTPDAETTRLADLFGDILPKLRSFKENELQRQHDVQGDQVDVAAFLEGEPNHMIGWVPNQEQVTKRALCLVIGHSVSGGCSAEDLFARGRAAVELVRALQMFGYELEIWSEETVGPSGYGRSGEQVYSTLVRLHAAGEIMDETAVEYAIGNPSWLRRLLFASQECEDDKLRVRFGFGGRHGGGYGSIRPIMHGPYLNADLELNLGQTWFNSYQKDAALLWVVKQLQSLGVIPEDADLYDLMEG